jgi:hypothetical protein
MIFEDAVTTYIQASRKESLETQIIEQLHIRRIHLLSMVKKPPIHLQEFGREMLNWFSLDVMHLQKEDGKKFTQVVSSLKNTGDKSERE